jgi:hypothetical protein
MKDTEAAVAFFILLVAVGFILGTVTIGLVDKRHYNKRAVELEWAHYDAKTGDLKWTHFNGYYMVTGRKLDKEQD